MGEPGGLPSMGSRSRTRLKRLSSSSSSSPITKARVQVGGTTNWCVNSRCGSLQGSPAYLPAPESSEREGKNTHCLLSHYHVPEGFSGRSAGKESTFKVGDPGSFPGSERSAGEGIGCPLQYSWASLVAQLVKTPPSMWETWV